MKHRRFSDEQIVNVLKEREAGAKVDEICRRQGDPLGDLLHLWTALPLQAFRGGL